MKNNQNKNMISANNEVKVSPFTGSTETDGGYEMLLGSYAAKITKPRRGKTVRLGDENHSISWEYIGKTPEGTPKVFDENGAEIKKPRVSLIKEKDDKKERFIYQSMDADTDLEYIFDKQGIKENIIVKAPSDEYCYFFTLRTTGLSVRTGDEEKTLEFFVPETNDAPEKVHFTIPVPFMIDADGARSGNVYYELEEKVNEKYIFSIHANATWMNDSHRTFPVTIDPQIVIVDNITSENKDDAIHAPMAVSYSTGDGACDIPITSIALSTYAVEIDVGNNAPLFATLYPSESIYAYPIWHSNDESIATVVDGVIFAHNAGNTTVYATSPDGCRSAECCVSVVPRKPVTKITVSPGATSKDINETVTLRATILPSNASDKRILWASSNPAIATVNSTTGVATARTPGTTKIYAYAQDGSGVYGSCNFTVNPIWVETISVTPSSLTLAKGSNSILSATVSPENATCKSVYWYSCDPSIATIDEYTGKVTAIGAPGETVTLCAAADDGSQVVGCCELTVGEPIAVTSISLSENKIIMKAGETMTLIAALYPENAYDKTITWRSSNNSVATVDINGVVTSKKDGTVTITATSTSNNHTATCKVTVDSRARAIIEKDSHSFHVQFEDGKIWRNIGLDLSDRQKNYKDLYPPSMDEENYHNLIAEEQRYLSNIQTTFSAEQIAYLYLFDPLGIEYFMKNDACDDMDTLSLLEFKDEVYEAIFGTVDRERGKFFFRVVDGEARYSTYNGIDRTNIYSNAEVLFGFHNILDWDWSKFITSVFESLFNMVTDIPGLGEVIEAYQFLFHAGGFLNSGSIDAASFANDYMQETIENNIENRFGEKVKITAHWMFTLSTIVSEAALNAFSIPNPQDITIYNKVNLQPQFSTIIVGFDGTVIMQDIIDQVNPD